MILLNPGPVTLSERVRSAMVSQDLCHREPEFTELLASLRRRLARVYPEAAAEYAAVVIGGSGTAAVESMLSTFASRERPTLLVTNGIYSERMVQMLQRQGKPYVEVRSDWLDGVDVEGIEEALTANPEIDRVAVAHHETTTGRLNDLEAVASISAAYGAGLLLDAVSSFGVEDIRFDSWRPLAVASTANKCLHGAPGVSFVLARREALEQRQGNATSLYLDLENYHASQAAGSTPFTPPVPACLALEEALVELEESGGWRSRRSRYREIAARLRSSLPKLGIDVSLPEADLCSSLTPFRLPEGDSYDRVHDALKAAGFVIYGGQGHLGASMFRIANMGAIDDSDVDRLIEALEAVFSRTAAR
jgi:2-aminoethylphosphonate-pyruvate transaminase